MFKKVSRDKTLKQVQKLKEEAAMHRAVENASLGVLPFTADFNAFVAEIKEDLAEVKSNRLKNSTEKEF